MKAPASGMRKMQRKRPIAAVKRKREGRGKRPI
jgi:hypothetical protein